MVHTEVHKDIEQKEHVASEYFYESPKPEASVSGPALTKLASAPVELVSLKDNHNQIIKGFKGVYNLSMKEVVSVVSDTYNLLPNKQIIDPILNFFEKEQIHYYFDRFSWVNSRRMRLHFTFPEFKICDDTQEGILSSVFLHNSYDMIESFRMDVGGMRQICSNGMIIGKLLGRLKIIHKADNIQERAVGGISSILGFLSGNVAGVEEHIKQMIAERPTMRFLIQLSTKMERKIFVHVMRSIGLANVDTKHRDVIRMLKEFDPNQIVGQNQWQVYNLITEYISHTSYQRYRVDYIRRISRLFGL